MNEQQILQAARNAQPVRKLSVVIHEAYAEPFNVQQPIDGANVRQHISLGMTKLEKLAGRIAVQLVSANRWDDDVALDAVELAQQVLKRCDEVQRGRTPEP